MYYFTYYDGNIEVHYEFCDSDSVVDSFSVFDLGKINKWCELGISFPYQINGFSINLLYMYDSTKYDQSLCSVMFKSCIRSGHIKLYCEEIKK